MSVIERVLKTGDTMQVSDYELTPLTEVVKIQLPGKHAGLIWNHPKAVIVRTTDGRESHLPVRDVTRIVMWATLAGGLLGAIMVARIYRKN